MAIIREDMFVNNFFSEWKKNRAEVYEKRSGFSKVTDYIAIILIVFVAASYLYHNITNKPPMAKQQELYGINGNNGDGLIKTAHKETLPQLEKQRQSVLSFFHISTIDIIIIITVIGVYGVLRYRKRLKSEKEGGL